MTALHDTIGVDYAYLRRPDPRIAAQLRAALGDAQSVLNAEARDMGYRLVIARKP